MKDHSWQKRKGEMLTNFFRFFLEQLLPLALNTCTKMLRESSELGNTLFLKALLGIHQSKPLRVNMKEPVELELLGKIDEINLP